MFSAATKVYFTLSGLAVLSGALFVAATGDRSGFTLLVAAGAVSAALGVGVFAFVAPDVVALPASGEAGEEPARRPARPAGDGGPPRPSVWPVAAAAALGLLALGLALGKGYLVAGALLAVIVAFAWLSQVWREHPGWTRGMLDRLNDRYIIPIGLPGTVIALIGIGVVSFSRLLLAVDKTAATLVALVAALSILFGCALVAARPLGRSALGALATFASVTVLAAGIAGAVKGEREFEQHGSEEAVHLVADDLAFDIEELDLAPGHVKIDFENADGVQHNLSIYPDGGGEALFTGEIIDGGEHITYEFEGPPVGKYVFQCDIHPQQMRGTVLVVADSSGGKPPVPPDAPRQAG